MGAHAQLADPADPEEMAMTFTVGGLKTGFGRETFLSAFLSSGIPEKVALRMMVRMSSFLPQWEALIDSSFLPISLQQAYKALLRERLARL